MALFGTRLIDSFERTVLTIVALSTTAIGTVGGAALCWQLWGDAVVQSGFWTSLLTVSALTALPLFAATTHLGRLWVKTGSPFSAKVVYVAAMIAAASATLVEVVLCLYEIAVTGGSGDPHDLVILLTTVPVGATVGAAVFGIAATILDKIDT
jgi:hypothetical protein